MSGIHLVK